MSGYLRNDDMSNEMKKGIAGGIANHNDMVAVNSQLSDMSIHIQHPPTPLVACVCDGITDDSVAFQAINDFIYANGGGEMRLPRSQGNILILNQEINLNSNVSIRGYGWSSKIKTTVGSSGNGLNLLKAFEKSNITISKINIENLGYGKSGTWTPAGTFDGVGSCILMAGCENVVVENCIVLRGGATIGAEGIANIYFSCCKNSKIINNYVSICDNAIVVDAWYNQATGKQQFVNDGVIIQGNAITNGGGRGICIENINSVNYTFADNTARDAYFVANPGLLVDKLVISSNSKLQRYYALAVPTFWQEYPPYGSIVVNGNTITKMAYAGIQGNTLYNCTITNNVIDGNQYGRSYGNVNYFTWYGMEFVAGSKNAVISNNTIQNIKYNGIRCFEASDLIISNNNIRNCEDFGIFIKNVNDTMTNVRVDNNIVNVNVNGIFVGRSTESTAVMKNNSCSNNIVDFSVVGGVNNGIQFDSHTLSKCDGNIVNPISTHQGCTAIKATSGTKNSISNNTIINATRGIDLTNDVSSISDSNLIENCTSGYRLDNSAKTFINSKFRGTTTAFDVANGQTTASSRCRALNCDFDFVDTIKNGTGVVVWTIGSGIPSGVWENGDRVRNDSPTVGGVSEWVYTTGSFRPVGTTS